MYLANIIEKMFGLKIVTEYKEYKEIHRRCVFGGGEDGAVYSLTYNSNTGYHLKN